MLDRVRDADLAGKMVLPWIVGRRFVDFGSWWCISTTQLVWIAPGANLGLWRAYLVWQFASSGESGDFWPGSLAFVDSSSIIQHIIYYF